MRRKIKSALLSVVTVSVVTSFVLSGCSSKPENTAADNTGTSKETPITIKLFNRVNSEYVVEDNPVIKEIEKKTNAKLDIEIPPINSYDDRLNIVMASGEIPDIIFNFNNEKYNKWAQDGLLLEVGSLAKDYPNLSKLVTKEDWNTAKATFDGKVYAIPRTHYNTTPVIVVRKDWMDKVGISKVETPAELLELCKAFSTKDPDNNGKNDTYGFSLNPDDLFDNTLISAFNLRPLLVPNDKGKVEIFEQQEGFMPYVDFLRELYTSKAMDPEWYLNKQYDDRDKFNSGKSGTYYKYAYINTTLIPSIENVKKANPNATVDMILPLKDKKGERNLYMSASTWGQWSISKTTKDPKRVLKFVDAMFSEELVNLSYFGIQGVTYESFDPKTKILTRPDSMADAVKKYTSSYMAFNTRGTDGKGVINPGKNAAEADISNKNNETWEKNVKVIPFNPDSLIPGIGDLRFQVQDAAKKYKENLTKYICGMMSKEDFEKFIKNEHIPSQQKIVEAAQKYYDENVKGK